MEIIEVKEEDTIICNDEKKEDINDIPIITDKPKKIKCAGITEVNGEIEKCGRKAIKGSKFCGKHKKHNGRIKEITDNNEQAEQEPNNIEYDQINNARSIPKEYAGRSLYRLNIASYIFLENLDIKANIFGGHLSGVSELLQHQKDELTQIYEDLYEMYGDEYIEQILNPFTMAALINLQVVSDAIIINKKKA